MKRLWLTMALVLAVAITLSTPAGAASTGAGPPTTGDAGAAPAPTSADDHASTPSTPSAQPASLVPADHPIPGPGPNGRFVPVTPARLLDTRNGQGGGRFQPAEQRRLMVMGVGGVPATGVSAVVLNVTGTGATRPTHLRIFPPYATLPLVSSLNLNPGETVANSVTVGVGHTGEIVLFNNEGTTDVIVDVEGWYTLGTDASAGGFVPYSPTRLMDTRSGLGGTRLGPGETRNLAMPSWALNGKPFTAVLNVTVTNPSAGGHLTIWPQGNSMPVASNLNFTAGQTVANAVTVGVGATGLISIHGNASALEDVIVDLDGAYLGSPVELGGLSPIQPVRLMDTRQSLGGSVLHAGETRSLSVVGSGAPARGVAGVILNVTATNVSAATHVTAWPTGVAKPTASNLNAPKGRTVPNAVVVGVGSDGTISLYNNAGTVDLIVDLDGWFAGPVSAGDTTAPTLTIDSPQPSAVIDTRTTNSFTFTGTARDDGSAIGAVNLTVDGAPAGTATLDTTATPGKWRAEINAFLPGPHTVEVAAVDRAGNTATQGRAVSLITWDPNATILKPGVRQVATMSSPVVDYASCCHLTLGPGDASTVKVGDVLMSGKTAFAPRGFAIVVDYITRVGQNYELSFHMAALTEVFWQVRFHASTTLPGAGSNGARTIDKTVPLANSAMHVTGTWTMSGHLTVDADIGPVSWDRLGTGVRSSAFDGVFDQHFDLTMTPTAPISGAEGASAQIDGFSNAVDLSTSVGGYPFVMRFETGGATTVTAWGSVNGPSSWQEDDHLDASGSSSGDTWTSDHHATSSGGPAGIPAPITAPGRLDVVGAASATSYVFDRYLTGYELRTSRADWMEEVRPPPFRRIRTTASRDSYGGLAFGTDSLDGGVRKWSTSATTNVVEHLLDTTVDAFATPVPITIGQTVTATKASGLNQSYSFTGSKDQVIGVVGASPSNSYMTTALSDANGVAVPGIGYATGNVLYRLPADGTYVVYISENSPDGTLSITVNQPTDDNTPIVRNTDAGTTIGVSAGGPARRLHFPAGGGEHLTLEPSSECFAVTVIDPMGEVMSLQPNAAFRTIDTTVGGTYTLYVIPSVGPTPCAPTLWLSAPMTLDGLALNQAAPFGFRHDHANPIVLIPFTVATADRLSMFVNRPLPLRSRFLRVCLRPPGVGYSPNDCPNEPYGNPGPIDLPSAAAGTWTLELDYGTPLAEDVTVTASTPLTGAALVPDSANGNFTAFDIPGAMRRVPFSGVAGERLTFVSAVYLPKQTPAITIEDPNGNVIGYPSAPGNTDIRLPTTGTYSLLMRPESPDTEGSITWWASHAQPGPALIANGTAGQELAFDSIPGRRIDFPFTVNAGEVSGLTVVPSDPVMLLDVYIYDPSGVLMYAGRQDGGTTVNHYFQAQKTGVHHLVFNDLHRFPGHSLHVYHGLSVTGPAFAANTTRHLDFAGQGSTYTMPFTLAHPKWSSFQLTNLTGGIQVELIVRDSAGNAWYGGGLTYLPPGQYTVFAHAYNGVAGSADLTYVDTMA